ncbi:hypothetical protein SAMD00019534_035530 [Acytostelium subglobosum LB1]|uniref:hypothetical protein n=1 Tax=Acytostelium subglobosum LB1 TaxID=1410327 RepID=UPI000644E351|nr:hypothetical protein SAMD00019534_035530 [Acytostelium subglobosum LB1]GAM20378.1 hypothetical protein SAMD00019534_035530 [Acytostelium subglobosum LB1]|eukprot:XP_012759899.1 hypothetical protein SAMD00019534_035530 [Acytostelium subglobosum LB1]
MASQEQINEVEQNLRGILQPDTNTVQMATAKLNTLLKNPNASLILAHHIQSSQFKEIKHVAAVLMRKKLVVHWTKLSSQNREAVKNLMIDLFNKETDFTIRRSIAEIMIIICRVELPVAQWKQFTPFLYQLSSQQDPATRELQMHFFDTLLSNNCVSVAKHTEEMVVIMSNGLIDPVIRVRSSALRAVGSAMMAFSGQPDIIGKLINLLPPMIDVIKISIENMLEDDVITSYEVFDDLAESHSSDIVQQLPLICKFSLEVGSNSNIDPTIRTAAIEFLRTMVEYKPKVLKKSNLIQPLLQLLFHIMAAEGCNLSDELEDDHLYESAGIALRHCGEAFSARLVFNPILPVLAEFVASPDRSKRVAAPMIIQQLSYGCAEDMRDNIEQVVTLISKSLDDPDKLVRQNACVCMARLSENVNPEIYKYANVIFPRIFQSLSDPDDHFILRCCFALENFLSNLEREHLQPILAITMNKLGELMMRPNNQVKEFALSAICAIAISAEQDFEPYFDGVLNVIKDLLATKEPQLIMLRSNATECVGSLVKAVPKDKFRPIIHNLMTLAHDGITTLPSSELKEATFEFYARIFEHFGEELASFLPGVMEQLIKSSMSDDGVESNRQTENDIDGIDNDEDDEDDEDDLGTSISVRTSFLDEKCAAIHAIGVIAVSLPQSFLPYSGQVITSLEQLLAYFHEDIRFESLITLQSLAVSINTCFPAPNPVWTKGDFGAAVSEQVRMLLDFSFQAYGNILSHEKDKSVVSRAFGSIADTVALLGPGAIAPYLEMVGGGVLQVVMGNLYCQTANQADTTGPQDEEDEDDEDDHAEEDLDEEDDEDPDYSLLHYASECMIEIATVSGPMFKSYIDNALVHLLKLTKPTNHHSIRACVVGTVAEIIKVIETDCSNLFDRLYPMGIKGLKDESAQVRRVSCFLLGILASSCVTTKSEHYMAILQGVAPLLNDNEEPEVIDNALGCICRLIASNAQNVPLGEVLPLLFARLPVKKDEEEIGAVFNAIQALYSTKLDLIAPYTQKVFAIFEHDLTKKKLDQAVRTKIETFVTLLKGKMAGN